MIAPPPGVRVWLAAGVTDMRKGFDGLAVLVQQHLGQDPFSGQLFAFRGRRGDLVKILSWDGQGLCLYAKRLEKGRFVWPQAKSGAVSLTAAQLSMLLEGIDWVRRETGKRQEVKVHHGEGVAIHTDPESCANGREAAREALTGARAGQPLSGERLHNRSADVIQSAEGNTAWCVNASTQPAPRHRRPWHARMSFAREPRGLCTATGCRSRGRTGKARCRSR
jgi:transposase